jgi:hypothetical protein
MFLEAESIGIKNLFKLLGFFSKMICLLEIIVDGELFPRSLPMSAHHVPFLTVA